MTLLHLYVFVRLVSLPFFRRARRRNILIIAGVALWFTFLLGRFYGGSEYGFLTVALKIAGMHWMASLFLIAVGLFLGDVACGFGLLFPKEKFRIRSAGLAFGLAMVVIAHIQGFRAPVIETREVGVANLPPELDGTRLAVMTDLHVDGRTVGARWLNARIDQVRTLKPDGIILVGDLFEHDTDPAHLVPVMRRLSAPLGVWAVRGNHDGPRRGRRDVTAEILSGAGIRLIANEWEKMAEGLVLAGIDDLTISRRLPGEGEANLARALAGRPEGATLFLSHTPWLSDRAAAAGVDLMLSGHTHNGQIWPFNYLVQTRYPFIGGRYDIGNMALLVFRGTGTWGARMRLWAPGEITLITLRAPGSGNSTDG